MRPVFGSECARTGSTVRGVLGPVKRVAWLARAILARSLPPIAPEDKDLPGLHEPDVAANGKRTYFTGNVTEPTELVF